MKERVSFRKPSEHDDQPKWISDRCQRQSLRFEWAAGAIILLHLGCQLRPAVGVLVSITKLPFTYWC